MTPESDARDGRIPVLDIAATLAELPGAAEALADRIARTCQDTGFLVLTGHWVDPTLPARCFEAAARFFALPEEEKLALKVGELNIGYLPTGAQVIRTSRVAEVKKPNLNESFYIIRDRGPDHPDIVARKPFVAPNRWPPNLPGFREATMAYFTAMEALALRLLPIFSMALGMPRKYLDRDFRDPSCTLRLIRYQPQPGARSGPLRLRAAYRHQLHHLPGAIRPARAGSADAGGRVAAPAGHPRQLRGEHRRDAGTLFQRPLRADAAPRGQRQQRDALRHPLLLRPGQRRGDPPGAELRHGRRTRRATSRCATRTIAAS